MRVALYARVSTRDREQDPENQLMRLRDYCRSRGWDFTEFVDHASGAKTDRPALNELMRELSMFDGILVLRLDRFGRSVTDLMLRLQTIRNRGMFFESLDQGLRISGSERDAMAGLMFTILAAVAEFERELISDRVRDGLERARRNGKKLGRRRVATERGISDERILQLREEGRTIREMCQILGIKRSTLHGYLKELSENHPVENEA